MRANSLQIENSSNLAKKGEENSKIYCNFDAVNGFFPIGHFIKNMIWHNRRIFAKYRIYKLMFLIKKKFLDKKKKQKKKFYIYFL